MLKVLVNTGYYRETFAEMPSNVEVHFAPNKPFYGVREMPGVLPDYDALVIPSLFPVSNALLDVCPRLKLICNLGAGFNNVDIAYARQKGVTVCNTPDAVTQSTAELTLTLALSLMRRVAEHDRALRVEKEGLWHYDRLTSRSLEGKTLGIVGMGKIGRRVAEMAQVFRMRVVYYNPHTEVAGYERLSFRSLLQTADILSLHVPLRAETRHLLSDGEFALMKPRAVLVNVSRGAVVDEAALVRALQEKRIAGAALDVFENEPRILEELYAMPNVVLTPHIGGNTEETLYAMMRDSAANVAAYASGSPISVVN